MLSYKLGKNEQKVCGSIAKMRYENAREKGFGQDKTVVNVESYKNIDVDGVGSEMAAAKMLNVYYDIETDFQAHELPTHDLIRNGKTCLLYTSPSPRDRTRSRMPSSA